MRGLVIRGSGPLYRGYCTVNFYSLCIGKFDGSMSSLFTREVIDRGDAAAVLLYDPKKDSIVLIEQFRAGAMVAQVISWQYELVAGMKDIGESLQSVAVREVREEAGYEISNMEKIAICLSSSGITSETVTLFYAEVDSRECESFHGVPEENEDIRAFTIPAQEAIDMMDSRDPRLMSATLQIALHWLARHRVKC